MYSIVRYSGMIVSSSHLLDLIAHNEVLLLDALHREQLPSAAMPHQMHGSA